MKGMGTYTPFEEELSNLSSDELNELYLSGGLDKMYEDFERKEKAEPRYKRDYSYKTKVLTEDNDL